MLPIIHTIDLHFIGIAEDIAVYCIPHEHGAMLVECGPGSTLPSLQAGLYALGLSVTNISDVFLTHIHLDHGGSAGWWAQQGALVHVHPNGAPHLLNPEKLLTSAARIYGDNMYVLWGQFLPVLPEKLSVLQDGQVTEVGGLRVQAIDTPGHASHHIVYKIGDIAFTGDIGGIRLPGKQHLRLPTPPPEFHLETWKASIQRIRQAGIQRIAPTHFGIYEDVTWHLDHLESILDQLNTWLETIMLTKPSQEAFREQFSAWEYARAVADGLPPAVITAIDSVNPSAMSADGIYRYWKKFR